MPEQPLHLAAAQSPSIPGDLAANVRIHLDFAARAHAAGAGLVLFPELSLSGYELPLLQDLQLRPDDEVLAPLREAARRTGVTIVAGGPAANESGLPSIGAFTFSPEGSVSVYRKHHVHASEAPFAAPGPAEPTTFPHYGETLGLAICADVSHESHAEKAAGAGATLYLAGVLWSDDDTPRHERDMEGYASRYALGVLIANHAAPSGDYVSSGRSGFWAPGGQLVVAAPGPGSALVLVTKEGGEWRGEVVAGSPAS